MSSNLLLPESHEDWNQWPFQLVQWFRQVKRDLPWRHQRTPYRVLVSEMMLQQTGVETVIPYFDRFTERWPDFTALAQAEEEDVLKVWAGLGYYSRARNLWRAAQIVSQQWKQSLPHNPKELQKLPGVGAYTAAALLSFAFNLPYPAIDGNGVRVLSRLSMSDWQQGNPQHRKDCEQWVIHWIPQECPGDFNEALMDLGSTCCTPRSPLCGSCPLQSFCKAFKNKLVDCYPLPAEKKDKPLVKRNLLFLYTPNHIFLHRREERLLQGFYEGVDLEDKSLPAAGITLKPVRHVFTHKTWQISPVLLPWEEATKRELIRWAHFSSKLITQPPTPFSEKNKLCPDNTPRQSQSNWEWMTFAEASALLCTFLRTPLAPLFEKDSTYFRIL